MSPKSTEQAAPDTNPPHDLPLLPTDAEGYRAWRDWAKEANAERRFEILEPEAADISDPAVPMAWRALLAIWNGKRAPDPENAAAAALAFLEGAVDAPAPVVRAAELLLSSSMEGGATSAETLFLAGAFAWPLRHIRPALSAQAWEYLVHAPWQSSAPVWRQFADAALDSEVVREPRRLRDLVERCFDAGRVQAAVELLEGLVLLWSGRKQPSDFGRGGLKEDRKIPDASWCVERLARHYVEANNDQIPAREVIRCAVERFDLEALRGALEQRVWDRPILEAYEATDKLDRIGLEKEIRQALEAGQPHHARRLAESMLTRELDRHITGTLNSNLERASVRLGKMPIAELRQRPLVRASAEHLALLSARTFFATERTRRLLDRILPEPSLCEGAAPLAAARAELVRFQTEIDPYNLLRAQEAAFAAGDRNLNDDERRASGTVQAWVEKSFQNDTSLFEQVVTTVTAPVLDLASSASELPAVVDAVDSAFRTIALAGNLVAGDLSGLANRGRHLRAEYGAGAQLMGLAREATSGERWYAAAGSAVLSFLPPGISFLARCADVGLLLLVAFRAIARVAAVYGIDLATPEGRSFVADSFALGCSSKDGEGLFAYLTRRRQAPVAAVTLGAVAYGSSALVQHLWTAEGQPSRLVAEQLLQNASRMVGISLTHQQMAKLVPIGGAVIAGMSSLAFVESIREASLHLAAREALLAKIEAAA